MERAVTSVVFFLIILINSSGAKYGNVKADTAYVKIHQTQQSVPTSCFHPDVLQMDLDVWNVLQKYTLKKVKSENKEIPLYLLRKNTSVQSYIEMKTYHPSKDAVTYVSDTGIVTLQVECTLVDGNEHYTMRGFVSWLDGIVYSLEPRSGTIGNYQERIKPEAYNFTATPYRPGDMRLYEETPLHRDKRDTQEINIDVVALTGGSVYQRFYSRTVGSTDAQKRQGAIESIRLHFGLLFNSVIRRFHSADPNYNVRLVGCVIEEGEESEWVQQTRQLQGSELRLDGNLMLQGIWNWTTSYDNFPDNDAIVTFETLDLFSFTKNRYDYDFSIQSSICTVDSTPVVLVHFRDLIVYDMSALTHGLGHAFGALDDGPPNNCSSEDRYIMTNNYVAFHQFGVHNPFYFSSCSIQYFRDYISFRLGNSSFSRSCLLDTITPVNVTNVTGILPGEVYDPDEQCRLVYGAESYYCFNEDPLGHKDICKRLFCYYPPQSRCYFLFGAEGTTCGNKKWCLSGECAYSDDAPAADDECVHGDQEGISGGGCPSIIPQHVYYCYYSNIVNICCKSCKERRTADEGCQYGDNIYAEPNCQYSRCNESQIYTDTCCETCADFRTTTSTSTQTSATTASTVETPVTSVVSSSSTAAITSTSTTRVTSPTTTTTTTTAPTTTTIPLTTSFTTSTTTTTTVTATTTTSQTTTTTTSPTITTATIPTTTTTTSIPTVTTPTTTRITTTTPTTRATTTTTSTSTTITPTIAPTTTSAVYSTPDTITSTVPTSVTTAAPTTVTTTVPTTVTTAVPTTVTTAVPTTVTTAVPTTVTTAVPTTVTTTVPTTVTTAVPTSVTSAAPTTVTTTVPTTVTTAVPTTVTTAVPTTVTTAVPTTVTTTVPTTVTTAVTTAVPATTTTTATTTSTAVTSTASTTVTTTAPTTVTSTSTVTNTLSSSSITTTTTATKEAATTAAVNTSFLATTSTTAPTSEASSHTPSPTSTASHSTPTSTASAAAVRASSSALPSVSNPTTSSVTPASASDSAATTTLSSGGSSVQSSSPASTKGTSESSKSSSATQPQGSLTTTNTMSTGNVSRSGTTNKVTTPKPATKATTDKEGSSDSQQGDIIKLGIGLGVATALAVAVIVSVLVYKLGCKGRKKTASFSEKDWTLMNSLNGSAS